MGLRITRILRYIKYNKINANIITVLNSTQVLRCISVGSLTGTTRFQIDSCSLSAVKQW